MGIPGEATDLIPHPHTQDLQRVGQAARPLIFLTPSASKLPTMVVNTIDPLFVAMGPKSPLEERPQLQLIGLLYIFIT